jgi:hypothetical protein
MAEAKHLVPSPLPSSLGGGRQTRWAGGAAEDGPKIGLRVGQGWAKGGKRVDCGRANGRWRVGTGWAEGLVDGGQRVGREWAEGGHQVG